MNRCNSVVFEIASNYCISDSVDHDGYSIFFWGIPAHSSRYNGHLSSVYPFQSILLHWFLEWRCSLLPSPFDHFQFALIHGPNIPGSLVAQMLKCLSTMWETWVQSLDWEDPLEKEMAIHCSTVALKIPLTEEPDRLPSTGSQRVRHDWVTSLSLSLS